MKFAIILGIKKLGAEEKLRQLNADWLVVLRTRDIVPSTYTDAHTLH